MLICRFTYSLHKVFAIMYSQNFAVKSVAIFRQCYLGHNMVFWKVNKVNFNYTYKAPGLNSRGFTIKVGMYARNMERRRSETQGVCVTPGKCRIAQNTNLVWCMYLRMGITRPGFLLNIVDLAKANMQLRAFWVIDHRNDAQFHDFMCNWSFT